MSAHSHAKTRLNLKNFSKVVSVSLLLSALSGCLFTSPYWNQSFTTHNTAIPIQAWVTNNSLPVKIECANAFHGGTYPPFETPVWNFVTTISPQTSPSYAPTDGPMYGAGVKMVLPASCWHLDEGNNIYYTALRATQGTGGSQIEFKTFDKTGLECLGRENGKATSWFGWLTKDCTMTYSGSSTSIPFVIIYATS